ncbi:MAG: hypothetical protein JWO07_55, partial [Candidatus Saccharibacteria bacterium]|nr:hypothetical protein [Candidatus Saccharibacteria bacterium]
MSQLEQVQPVDALMSAMAEGKKISPQLARESGYDVHVLQRYMNLAVPKLDSLEAYKPLAIWLRETKDSHVRSEQDLKYYKEVLRLMQVYVNINQP